MSWSYLSKLDGAKDASALVFSRGPDDHITGDTFGDFDFGLRLGRGHRIVPAIERPTLLGRATVARLMACFDCLHFERAIFRSHDFTFQSRGAWNIERSNHSMIEAP